MRRTVVSGSVFVLLGLLAWGWAAAHPPKPAAKPKGETAPSKPARDSESLPELLARRVKFTGFEDNKVSLAEALENLTKGYAIPFEVNERAFRAAGVEKVQDVNVTGHAPIPAGTDVRLELVLRKVLARVEVPNDTATYLVRRDRVEITTGLFARAEVWGANDQGPFLPLVSARLEQVPLAEALRVLADRADFNVVLDPAVGDKVKAVVSATFYSTPLDTAVRLLANMAEARAVQAENVLYVTTKEHAEALEAQAVKKELMKKEKNPLDDSADMGWQMTGPGGMWVWLPRVGGM